MKFETARVCVLRRTLVPPEDLIESNPFANPEFEYETLAWPPGEIDGGLVPLVGDELSLPGWDQPFRVVGRAVHWPPPSSPAARNGSVQVNLAVEPVDPSPLNRPPFGRPGQEAGGDRRWLRGRIDRFEERPRYRRGPAGEVLHYCSIWFQIPGVGSLNWAVGEVWRAQGMFPGFAPGAAADEPFEVHLPEFRALLEIGQEFDCEVGPSSYRQVQGLVVHAVRPPQPAPGEEA